MCIRDRYGSSGGDYIKIKAGNTDTMYIGAGAAGRVGIGTSSSSGKLHLSRANADHLYLERSGHDTFRIALSHSVGLGIYNVTDSRQDVMIDGSGRMMVGTTSANGVDGVTLNNGGYIYGHRSGGVSGYFDRATSDGDLVEFRKDSSKIGSIGTSASSTYYGGSSNGAIYINGQTDIRPWNTSSQANLDSSMSLGSSSARFADLHLSGTANVHNLVGTADGSFVGKFAVKNSGVHGSFDFYNNGTSYFNGTTYVDDILHITGSNAEIRSAGNIYLTGSNDRRIKLSDSGIAGVSDSNNTVHIRGDNDFMKLMAAGNGGFIFEENGTEKARIEGSYFLVKAREKYIVDGATYGKVIIRWGASATGDRLSAITADLNSLLGLSTNEYGTWEVSFGGYGGSGTNGCTGSFTMGGYTGHSYSSTNHNSYGAGTINVGYSSSGGASTGAGPLSYHPVQNNGMYIMNGEVWVYNPSAQEIGIMIKNNGSQPMYGTMTVIGTIR